MQPAGGQGTGLPEIGGQLRGGAGQPGMEAGEKFTGMNLRSPCNRMIVVNFSSDGRVAPLSHSSDKVTCDSVTTLRPCCLRGNEVERTAF
jgi:hypothetical protein